MAPPPYCLTQDCGWGGDDTGIPPVAPTPTPESRQGVQCSIPPISSTIGYSGAPEMNSTRSARYMSLEKVARPVAFFCSPAAVHLPSGLRIRMPVFSKVRFADSSTNSTTCEA
eukprot:1235131-Pyramimonas_sp.AAC.2